MGTDNGTGWEFHRRTHFDEIVANYDKARPEYPDALFADVFAYAGSGKKALEIGAGTGKATLPFLRAGYDVTAVEMGANMAAFLLERFKEYKHFSVINATFEDALLADDSYDLIYAASAFHWVDLEIGFPKVLRLLKKGGTFALFRYNSLPIDGDALYEELEAVYDRHYRSYYTSSQRWRPRRSPAEFEAPAAMLSSYGFKDLRDHGFRDVAIRYYEVKMTYSADDYIALCDTMADNRALPEANKTALYTGAREAIERHGGRYREDNVFRLYIGRKE